MGVKNLTPDPAVTHDATSDTIYRQQSSGFTYSYYKQGFINMFNDVALTAFQYFFMDFLLNIIIIVVVILIITDRSTYKLDNQINNSFMKGISLLKPINGATIK
jgi:hypothetical protein